MKNPPMQFGKLTSTRSDKTGHTYCEIDLQKKGERVRIWITQKNRYTCWHVVAFQIRIVFGTANR